MLHAVICKTPLLKSLKGVLFFNLIYTFKIMIKLIALICLFSFILLLFFGFTDPESLPIGFLVVPILMFFIVFFLLGYLLMAIFWPKMAKLKRRSFSILMGILSAMVVLFYSAGGIVTGDLILIILILFIGALYINKY